MSGPASKWVPGMLDHVVKVLIVDDSKVARLLLAHILESDPQIRVIGAVADGQAAVDFVEHQTPDAILMDIQMPRMDGFEATRRIMETRPVPIIVCSAAVNPESVASMFRVMEVGAVACVEKPVGRGHPEFAEVAAKLRQTVKLMSEVKVVRRWARPRSGHVRAATLGVAEPNRAGERIKIVGIGASTGGPQVLQEILAGLSREFPVPILIVQHISRGFLPGLAEWLQQTSAFQVHIGASGVHPLAGHVYLAPDDFHMGVNLMGQLRLQSDPPENNLRPSVSYLFRSLAQTFGSAALGVLLSGMGKDGAAELKLMKDQGAVTIAQDRESSVVFGMPGEAVKLGAAAQVLPAAKIAAAIAAAVKGATTKEEQS